MTISVKAEFLLLFAILSFYFKFGEFVDESRTEIGDEFEIL